MRVIEKKMIDAINTGREMKCTNTRVSHNENGDFVWLYDTLIFARVGGISFYSDGGFKTVTTGSRLRALGAEYSINERKNAATLHTQKEMYDLFWDGKIA